MRVIETDIIKSKIKELLLNANYSIDDNILNKLKECSETEKDDVSVYVLNQIIENDILARKEEIPMCQDTGMAVIVLEIGQEVHFNGEYIEDAVNEGVREAYTEGYLRKSVVSDPVYERINTDDNTPSIIYTRIIPGDKVHIHVMPKGFGSENMSRIKMLKPSDGEAGIIDFVTETVRIADANPCPPIVVGIGIGGTFEKAALLSKFALLRDVDSCSEKHEYRLLEEKLMKSINALKIGPAGFGGKNTCLGVNVEYYPTHIAGMPVAVNICCHAFRHGSATI